MGFLGKVFKAVGNVAKKVGDIAGKVASIGSKVLNVINKPMEMLTSPIKKLAGGLLDKLPFGLGKLVKPFADKFIDGAASFLSGNVLGGIGILGKAAKTVGDVVNIAETIKKGADKVGAFAENPSGVFNFQNIIAQAQARLVE